MSVVANAVFLSYASQDAEAVRGICDALRALKVEVWFDRSALRGGDAWDTSIRRQIKECALFVPVISSNTQSRGEGYFRLEWKLAVDRSHLMADDRAFLLPVVIDTKIDGAARVPERFRDVQWTHLSANETPAKFAEHVRRLLSDGAAPFLAASPGVTPFGSGVSSAPAPPSIAVLPFANRSHDEEDEYFSDGLADELINVLAKIRGLRVAARSSAFTFKGKGATVAEVGRALHVATVLEGSVRKAGNRLRILVQLVKVADGFHLWSETYDRTLEDIFAVQDDIAKSVVTELRSTLLGEAMDAKSGEVVTAQVAGAVKGRATDPEAHRLYLQARHFIDRLNSADTTKGIGYLERAVTLEPAFALAWVQLGVAYAIEADQGWAAAADGYRSAREAVAHALALEPDLAEGHAQMGWIRMVHDWDWKGAEESFHRALEGAPGNAGVLRRAGVLAANLGRLDEAIEFDRRAVEQDPLSAGAYTNLGMHLHANGRFAEAELPCRKAIELAPQRATARTYLALNLLAQGQGEEALAEARREPEEWARLWASAIIHHSAGRRAESDAALQTQIAKYHAQAACQIAQAYAARGETDIAFEWLERAYAQRDPGVSEVRTELLFASLHNDPRWDDFLRRLGLAD